MVELFFRARTRGSRHQLDWTFYVLAVTLVAGFALGFRAAHELSTAFRGGWPVLAAGLVALALGIALRSWAMVALGRFFTFAVSIQADHRVVRTGPYRVVRHPGYAGSILALAGLGLALENWLSLLALVGLPLAGFLVRIPSEERTLTAALGDDYREYAAGTARLLPGVW